MLSADDPGPTNALTIHVASFLDALWCSREGGRYAAEAGFGAREAWEISIAVSELATNIVRFAGEGELTLERLPFDRGVRIVADDEGPGFVDIGAALVDGYSEGRVLAEEVPPNQREGLGAGLGAVDRLMDTLSISNREPRGARVVATKRLPGALLRSEQGGLAG